MAQYIDKHVLAEKIEKRKKYNHERAYLDRSSSMAGREEEDKDIISIINTLDVKEVDLEKEIESEYNPTDGLPFEEFARIAKQFYELGLQSQNEGKIVIEEEGTCNKILNRIVGKNWNLICPVYKMNVNNGEKVKIRIIKGE